jgi:hypothetical protein
MHNLIYDCSSAGIAVQNQCDALIANNTIVDCGRGIRFFDHTGRWGPPYCLNPGSGRATVINTIIWNCPTPMELTDSPYPQDLGSHVTILHSTIEGGQSALSVSANSTVQWGTGNLTSDPLLTGEHRLSGGSPAIDAGTDPGTVAAILAVWAGSDREGMARPLDGDGDGQSGWDMGASEFLLAQADSNLDGIPDGWCREHGLDPLDGSVAEGDADVDGPSNLEEWLADTNPTNALSFLRIDSIHSIGPEVVLRLTTSSNRVYGLLRAGEVSEPAGGWQPVPGQEARVGTGGLLELSDAEVGAAGFYRVQARLP